MSLRFLALASIASVAVAQSGYGRFPCTNVNGDGTFSADDTKCLADALIAPGADTTNTEGNQGDGVTPTDPVCSIETATGAYFCGITGATCTSDDNCDNSVCDLTSGTCQGGFGQDCNGDDTFCSGFLYCNSADFTTGTTCGGIGSFCQDYTQGSSDFTNAENYAIFNQFCAGGYCNTQTQNCDTHGALGDDCSSDPEFFCGGDLVCNADNICAVAPVPSAARARRSLARRSGLCPASHTACAVSGVKAGFECIDVASNLEQCGACASAGGVDCTALPGVEAVGCVAGQCEIWSCAEGFSWDASSASCQA
ncbi:antifreeze glycopeptide AFGP poly protein [Leucosporidium creatinivorum]|uniref:Antifreeze glycopeptide AFGP poly protein n=1 Tax=Leucosporidium creatinivorum TaxID=106004 RepID=A0A1Y2EB12_9BASI|nr:antifreeze glycopeptide AFGP poly protein [Leucosporidium creatinivorum]